jgi:hypothetical protein
MKGEAERIPPPLTFANARSDKVNRICVKEK